MDVNHVKGPNVTHSLVVQRYMSAYSYIDSELADDYNSQPHRIEKSLNCITSVSRWRYPVRK